VVFATIETILFAWVFGIEEAWTELHVGADITIPRFYRFIIKYVTPLVLIVILVTYAWQTWAGRLGAAGAIALETWDGVVAGVDPPIPLAHQGLVRFVETLLPATTNPAVFGTQIMLVGLFVTLVLLVKIVWRRRTREAVP
jgi:hypothetical protein